MKLGRNKVCASRWSLSRWGVNDTVRGTSDDYLRDCRLSHLGWRNIPGFSLVSTCIKNVFLKKYIRNCILNNKSNTWLAVSEKINCTHSIAGIACPETPLDDQINIWQSGIKVPQEKNHLTTFAFAVLILNAQWWSYRDTVPTIKVQGGNCFLLCHTWHFIPCSYSPDPWHLILDGGNADIWSPVLDLWHWNSVRKITGTWSAWSQLLDIWWCPLLWHVYHSSKFKTASTAKPKNSRIWLYSADTVTETWC